MPMKWGEYVDILSELDLTASWAGRTLARSDVTGRRWVTKSEIPESVAIVLRLMQAGLITRADVEEAKRGKIAPRAPERSIKRKRSSTKQPRSDAPGER